MNFSNTTFLFIFLPISLVIYYITDRRYRNLVALFASTIFFAWGQVIYLPLMLFIIALNYYLGLKIEQQRGQEGGAGAALGLGIIINLFVLVFFKVLASYGTGWLIGRLPFALSEEILVQLQANPMPLGISYIAFQVISYLIDVYNEICDSEKNFLNFSLYILLFPKIITGPITRYRDISAQLTERDVSGKEAASGVRRFILGLAKKALIADPIARIVIPAFALETPSFSPEIAWLVILGYSLQLFFDFSGYTDMAIGLGQMLGFRFPENFNYPYISKSISEFWRRWHLSLSSWFRDYVFYPLEFARRGKKWSSQQLHILIVFLLTGLWHGLTLNFVIWGMIHGLAIALEMSGFGRWLKKTWAPVQYIYTLLIVLVGWVFFRSTNPLYAVSFLERLVGSQRGVKLMPFSATQPLPIIENSVILALVLGVLFSVPIIPFLQKRLQKLTWQESWVMSASSVVYDMALLLLLVTSVAALVSTTLVSSIYGGF